MTGINQFQRLTIVGFIAFVYHLERDIQGGTNRAVILILNKRTEIVLFFTRFGAEF